MSMVLERREQDQTSGAPARLGWLLSAVVLIVVTVAAAQVFPFALRWPDEWVLPAQAWVTDFFSWLATDASLGLFTVREATRFVAWLLSWPLFWMEGLLFRGFSAIAAPPLPWIAIVGMLFVFGHWLRDAKLGLFCAAAAAYIAVFGLWSSSMQTLALVVVAVVFAALIGLQCGILATRSPRFEKAITRALDVMQSTPHMAYLAPAVVMFGFGQVPALLATVVFAMPPMARCVILGIKTVSPEIIESGRMAGCTPRQLLWKVELPAAQRTLLLGLNQVVMQTLAMVVIASLVGATGLGQRLLFSLQQLHIGEATEQGIAIVLIAVVLDRLTQAYAYRPDQRPARHMPFILRHRHSIAVVAVVTASYLLSRMFPALQVLPGSATLSYGEFLDQGVRWISLNLYEYIRPARDWITVQMLLPLRNFYLQLPWPTVLGLIAIAGWRLGGARLAAKTVSLAAFIMVIGNWVPAMLTIYLVTAATILAVLIGTPIGVWASRSERVARIVMGVCDTLQTFPSFIYLIPVVMLLQVGDLSNVIAILAYASVPSVRYTYLGIKRIPAATLEAARAAGCTSWQRLRHVELPLAMPEIMLGINQTIMMALIMTAITALIGSRDLGQEIYKALPGANTGQGLLAGLSIAFIGIIADRLIAAWALRRKRELGFA